VNLFLFVLDQKNSPSKKASPKKVKLDYKVSEENTKLIEADVKNKKIWNELINNPDTHRVYPLYT